MVPAQRKQAIQVGRPAMIRRAVLLLGDASGGHVGQPLKTDACAVDLAA